MNNIRLKIIRCMVPAQMQLNYQGNIKKLNRRNARPKHWQWTGHSLTWILSTGQTRLIGRGISLKENAQLSEVPNYPRCMKIFEKKRDFYHWRLQDFGSEGESRDNGSESANAGSPGSEVSFFKTIQSIRKWIHFQK